MPPKHRQPPANNRRVALGVMGVTMLIFFSIIFMFGRSTHLTEVSHVSLHIGAQQRNNPSGVTTSVRVEVPESDKADPDFDPTNKAFQQAVVKGEDNEGLTQLDKDYKPTREMVRRIAQDGYLVVTWANWHYQDFVRTWVTHVRKCGITGYLVGAMDDTLLEMLIKDKVNVFSMKSGLTLGDFGWGSKTFAKMGREKIKLIRVFLQLGVQVVISDVDVLWLRNPVPYFKQYPDADILTSSDHLANTVAGYELEKHTLAGSAANIGIMVFREKSMDFVNKWIDIIERDEQVWDQNAFNDLFKKYGLQSIPGDTQNLFKAYNGSLTMGILPVSVFCSGHTFFTQRLYEKLKLQPYAVHATFQFSGTPGKRNRMREFMLFDDLPEYYDHKVGFVSFRMDGINKLLADAGPNDGTYKLSNVQGHFRLMTHQILRIRTAMAISTILGRALVMPELWCGQDRWWAPHNGRIPGSALDLPFKCPMDHVFDLEAGLYNKLPEDQFGPHIEFKEYSFLKNSKLPSTVYNSHLLVELCYPGEEDCSDGTAPAPIKNKKVRVQAGLMSEELKTALQHAQNYKVLEFSTMYGAFKNFTDEGDWTKFFNRVRGIGSIWCCVQAHPGHVHYDPWFDIPHVDKFNRYWDKWQPTCGP